MAAVLLGWVEAALVHHARPRVSGLAPSLLSSIEVEECTCQRRLNERCRCILRPPSSVPGDCEIRVGAARVAAEWWSQSLGAHCSCLCLVFVFVMW